MLRHRQFTSLLLLLSIRFQDVFTVTFVNICNSSSGGKCCAPGMENSEYWIMKQDLNWHDLDLECRVEDPPTTHLAVFENRAEMNCLIKFIIDEYPSENATNYAIGLESPDDYLGVYEWRSVEDGQETPTFTNWASGHPQDQRCVSMVVGVGAKQTGVWVDGDCNRNNGTMFGICEKKLPVASTTTGPTTVITTTAGSTIGSTTSSVASTATSGAPPSSTATSAAPTPSSSTASTRGPTTTL